MKRLFGVALGLLYCLLPVVIIVQKRKVYQRLIKPHDHKRGGLAMGIMHEKIP